MTLTQLAYLLGTDPKWVLNTLKAVRDPGRYSEALARRLAVTRAIHNATGIPLARGFELAEGTLAAHRRGENPVIIRSGDHDVGLVVDVRRILSSFGVRLSALRTTVAGAQRGRPAARRRDPLQAARDWGIDVTLLAENLTMTPAQRVRQLDAMAAFARGVRRASPSAH